jgi:hypothetical protein
LQATATGVTDPALEVAQWVDRLDYALDGGLTEPAEEAWEVLSMWAALKRVRPELLAQAEGEAVLDQAEQQLQRASTDYGHLAVSSADPTQWLAEARALDRRYDEELIPPDTETNQAADLVQDLDETDLLFYALGKWQFDPAPLKQPLAECHRWLVEHADVLGAASVVIQATAAAIRPDLESFDPELARTADKYPTLLAALAEIETELSLADHAPFSPEQMAVLPYVRPEAIATGWLPPKREPVLAAAGESAAPRVHWRGIWDAPSGERTAQLILLSEPAKGDEEVVTIAFYGSDGQPDPAIDDVTIELAGIKVQAEAGTAQFRLGDLRQGHETPQLRVASELWTLRPSAWEPAADDED